MGKLKTEALGTTEFLGFGSPEGQLAVHDNYTPDTQARCIGGEVRNAEGHRKVPRQGLRCRHDLRKARIPPTLQQPRTARVDN